MVNLSPPRTLLVIVCLFGILASCGDDGHGSPPVYAPTVKLLVFSDPHYFEPSLGASGAAFENYLAHDRKLIAESDAIMRALLAQVQAENPQVVLIPGDLTKDGEQRSHQSVAIYLRQMQASGTRVFVVPGNHDIENINSMSYMGGSQAPVPSISATDFAAIYNDFGYSAAIARDRQSLSYVAELVPGLWLLALDSCIYTDSVGGSETAGRLLDSTKAWISAQLDLARSRGIRVVGMMHHGLVEHFASQALVFPEFLVDDRDGVGSLLSNGGMGVVFTGHFHANDITQGTPTGASRSIYDIETGSAVTYPCPYRVITLASDVLTITTKAITSIDYDLKGAPDFQSYARDSLRIGLEGLITGIITQPPYSVSATDAAQLGPWLGDGLVAHYVGDEVMPADALVESQTLLSAKDFVHQLAGSMLQSIYTDLQPSDNDVTLDLSLR
jgi:predicted phosphodiesterase